MSITIASIQSHKNQSKPLVCLTAYTAPIAEILDPHCDILLVGDSMGMVVYGMENTLGVTLDMMIAHGKAVASHAKNAMVMVDMPYGTYEDNADEALKNARRIMDESGCACVKLEGGAELAPTVKLLVDNGIPVVAHIGLQPQSVVKEGGYKVKGKTEESRQELLAAAKAHEEAGAFALLIEGTVEKVATELTQAVSIPTIGIGAGRACDGQILVTDDMMGLLSMHTPKFVRQYGDLRSVIETMAIQYADEVRRKNFPAEEHIYNAPKPAPLKKAS